MSELAKRRRTKGNGYLFKRGAYYYVQFKVNGKRKVLSLETKSKEDAAQKVKQHFSIINSQTSQELALHVQQAR